MFILSFHTGFTLDIQISSSRLFLLPTKVTSAWNVKDTAKLHKMRQEAVKHWLEQALPAVGHSVQAKLEPAFWEVSTFNPGQAKALCSLRFYLKLHAQIYNLLGERHLSYIKGIRSTTMR